MWQHQGQPHESTSSGPAPNRTSASGWGEYFDPKHQRFYYVHAPTSTTTWTQPPEFRADYRMRVLQDLRQDAISSSREGRELTSIGLRGNFDYRPPPFRGEERFFVDEQGPMPHPLERAEVLGVRPNTVGPLSMPGGGGMRSAASYGTGLFSLPRVGGGVGGGYAYNNSGVGYDERFKGLSDPSSGYPGRQHDGHPMGPGFYGGLQPFSSEHRRLLSSDGPVSQGGVHRGQGGPGTRGRHGTRQDNGGTNGRFNQMLLDNEPAADAVMSSDGASSDPAAAVGDGEGGEASGVASGDGAKRGQTPNFYLRSNPDGSMVLSDCVGCCQLEKSQQALKRALKKAQRDIKALANARDAQDKAMAKAVDTAVDAAMERSRRVGTETVARLAETARVLSQEQQERAVEEAVLKTVAKAVEDTKRKAAAEAQIKLDAAVKEAVDRANLLAREAAEEAAAKAKDAAAQAAAEARETIEALHKEAAIAVITARKDKEQALAAAARAAKEDQQAAVDAARAACQADYEARQATSVPLLTAETKTSTEADETTTGGRGCTGTTKAQPKQPPVSPVQALSNVRTTVETGSRCPWCHSLVCRCGDKMMTPGRVYRAACNRSAGGNDGGGGGWSGDTRGSGSKAPATQVSLTDADRQSIEEQIRGQVLAEVQAEVQANVEAQLEEAVAAATLRTRSEARAVAKKRSLAQAEETRRQVARAIQEARQEALSEARLEARRDKEEALAAAAQAAQVAQQAAVAAAIAAAFQQSSSAGEYKETTLHTKDASVDLGTEGGEQERKGNSLQMEPAVALDNKSPVQPSSVVEQQGVRCHQCHAICCRCAGRPAMSSPM